MNIKPIRTKTDYKNALSRIELLRGVKKNSANGDELDILITLVAAYEEKHQPIAPPHPIEAIKFRLEQMGITRTELAKMLGTASRVSEIFAGKRRLTVAMMKTLHRKMNIPAESLLAD